MNMSEKAYAKWLADLPPAARARVEGRKPEAPATSAAASNVVTIRYTKPAEPTAPVTARYADESASPGWLRRLRARRGDGRWRGALARALGWFFLVVMGASLLGIWTCGVALFALRFYTL